MTIALGGVYEGNGVVKLERPVALEENARVRVILETVEEASGVQNDDPTGWKAADELIGFMKDGPKGSLGEEHDEHLYRK